MKKRIFALLLALCTVLAGCGGKKSDAIVIYDGQFAEMNIIHCMVKELVEAETDLKVEIKDEMAPPNLFSELTGGGSDLMNSYDGTLLTTFLHLDPGDVPAGVTLYDFVNEKGREMENVMLLGKLGINNTYTIAVTEETAAQYGLETISDLAGVSGELIFGAEHDFFTEEGRAKFTPFSEFYGLNFKEVKQIDINLKYSAISSGNIAVTVVYATDGLNRDAGLKILEDDKNFFPEYNGALLVKTDFFERYQAAAPELNQTLAKLEGIFTDQDMVNLSYEVDINGRTPAEVASEYLKGKGIIER